VLWSSQLAAPWTYSLRSRWPGPPVEHCRIWLYWIKPGHSLGARRLQTKVARPFAQIAVQCTAVFITCHCPAPGRRVQAVSASPCDRLSPSLDPTSARLARFWHL
jgi:hypothetical protein